MAKRIGLVITVCILFFSACGCVRVPEKSEAPRPFAGKTILLTGDSRSSDDYTFYQSILAEKTGAAVLLKGASGKDVAYNASDAYFDSFAAVPHDYSIWLVGGNDTGEAGTVGTFRTDSELGRQGEPVVCETDLSADYAGTAFIQATDHMIRKYLSLADSFARMNGGRKPVLIFCTDLPQQREDASTPWSDPDNWERKRLAILECCEKNGIPCLDLLTLCGFDMSLEPYWVGPTDTVHDNGVYFMDGLHPNPRGIDRITELEITEMLKYEE